MCEHWVSSVSLSLTLSEPSEPSDSHWEASLWDISSRGNSYDYSKASFFWLKKWHCLLLHKNHHNMKDFFVHISNCPSALNHVWMFICIGTEAFTNSQGQNETNTFLHTKQILIIVCSFCHNCAAPWICWSFFVEQAIICPMFHCNITPTQSMSLQISINFIKMLQLFSQSYMNFRWQFPFTQPLHNSYILLQQKPSHTVLIIANSLYQCFSFTNMGLQTLQYKMLISEFISKKKLNLTSKVII